MDELYTALSPIKDCTEIYSYQLHFIQQGGFYFVVLINAFGYMFHVIVYALL